MSADTVINLAIAAFLALAALVRFRLCRTPRQIAARKRVGFTVWDMANEQWVHLPPGAQPGPGQLTSREITEADPLELLWLAPAYDPELAAGCDRLRAAIRDEEQGEAS